MSEFMTIFGIAADLDDDVGMRLEQTDDLVAGGWFGDASRERG
jgi:hypothetical protein